MLSWNKERDCAEIESEIKEIKSYFYLRTDEIGEEQCGENEKSCGWVFNDVTVKSVYKYKI
jgi:hypothetical protein